MTVRSWPLLAAMVLALGGCASAPGVEGAGTTTAALQGDAARPAAAAGWLRSELYFAVAPVDGADAGEAQQRWRDFLDREVTPRFPDGLSVFDAYGQWQARGAPAPNRLASKALVILHPDTPEQRARIDAIRLAWKRETGHQSVLWARQRVEVSF